MSSDQPKKKATQTSALVNLGAINKATGKYETPIFATKKNEYACPDCGQDVILKQGEVRKYHFAHYSSLSSKNQGECSYYSHPGESQIHKHAKELLKVALEKKRCTIWRGCELCRVKLLTRILKIEKLDTIEVECPFEFTESRKVADVAVLDRETYIKFIFEIYNTHKTKESDRPEPWYEFEALELIQEIENCQDGFKIRCIRQKFCDLCLKFKNLDSQEPDWFFKDGRTDQIEWYVRYKLGQRDFSDTVRKKIDNNGKWHDVEPKHLEFDYYANSPEKKEKNRRIINKFNKFFKNNRPQLTCYWGAIVVEFLVPKIDGRRKRKAYEFSPKNKTVDVMLFIIFKMRGKVFIPKKPEIYRKTITFFEYKR